MTILFLVLAFGATGLALTVLHQLVCFSVALYELLNAPDTPRARPTLSGLVVGLVDLAVQTLALVGLVLALPLGMIPWHRVPRLRADAAPPLVFVPGWGMNRACFLMLRRRLRHDGWPHAVGFNYPSVHGDVLDAAKRLRDAVEALCRTSGAPEVILIAHGIGGIVCRAYLRRAGVHRVAKIVTLATPHQGNKLFALSPDAMLQDVRDGSPLMAHLGDDDPLPGRIDFTAIYASFDHLVVPSSRAHYPGVANIEVEAVGHWSILWSRRVYALIRENLETASRHDVPLGRLQPAG